VLPVCYPKGEIFGNDPQKPRFATIFWSDDRGQSWRRSNLVLELPMRGAMEPTVAEKPSGGLLMVLRTQLGSIFVSESDDGIRWSPPQTSGITTSESRSCIHRIPGTSEMVLIWNPARYQPALHHLGLRTPLAAAISSDNGKSWSRRKEIESDPNYEYTNMSMDFTSNGKMIVHYMASRMLPGGQFGRSAIDARVAVVPLEWLRRP
jgi:sialidase-1